MIPYVFSHAWNLSSVLNDFHFDSVEFEIILCVLSEILNDSIHLIYSEFENCSPWSGVISFFLQPDGDGKSWFWKKKCYLLLKTFLRVTGWISRFTKNYFIYRSFFIGFQFHTFFSVNAICFKYITFCLTYCDSPFFFSMLVKLIKNFLLCDTLVKLMKRKFLKYIIFSS